MCYQWVTCWSPGPRIGILGRATMGGRDEKANCCKSLAASYMRGRVKAILGLAAPIDPF